MKLHRFYTGTSIDLSHYVTVADERIINQWQKVLRFRPGQQVVLFDGAGRDRLYTITELNRNAAQLELVTELAPKTPQSNIYLLWSLLKKDKNDWVLQKCTELGISQFVPVLAERSEKTGFNLERAQKIVIEAAEQCGRSDIPRINEPLLLQTALHEYASQIPILVCEQHPQLAAKHPHYQEVGVLVGPEGGWSDSEKQIFKTQELAGLYLSDFTLRAETACVVAASRLVS